MLKALLIFTGGNNENCQNRGNDNGPRRNCDLNLVGKIAESEITLDRFQKLYKYYM